MSDISTLEQAIRANLYNPENIFIDAWRFMDNATKGKVMPENSTSPLVGLSEMAIMMATITNDELDRVTKAKLPEYAQNIDQLAEHLTFNDQAQLAATPSTLEFNLMIPFADLVKEAIKIDGSRSKIVIPKETQFIYKNSLYFGLLHDIEIIITNNDNVDAYYIENNNPIHNLLNPVISVKLRKAVTEAGDVIWVEFPITLHQFRMESEIVPVTQAGGFTKIFNITDQYCRARVYTEFGGRWVELDTAISDFLYSPNGSKATCLVIHGDKKVKLTIPEIFFTRGMISGQVKVEMITTRGAFEETFQGISPNDWKIVFKNTDASIMKFVNAASELEHVHGYTTSIPAGGMNMPTFEELRETVKTGPINNKPITLDALSLKLATLGYSTVHDKNYIGESVYLASKPVNFYPHGSVNTIVGASNAEIRLENLSTKAGVVKNGANFTITPDAVMLFTSNYSKLLTVDEKLALLAKPDLEFVSELNNHLYMACPFYYLVENTSFNTKVDCFNLDTPKVITNDYHGSNSGLIDKINTKDVKIRKLADGYVIDIHAVVSSGYKEYPNDAFVPQLVYKDRMGDVYSVNGKFTSRTGDDDYIFTFLLATDLDLSVKEGIRYTNLTNRNDYDTTFAPLEISFDLTYNLITRLPATVNNELKEKSDHRKLPRDYVTNTYETLKLEVGKHLDVIYTPIKSSEGEIEWLTYPNDIMAYWPKRVYKRDVQGNIVTQPNPNYDANLPFDPDTNSPVLYTVLHEVGDPVMVDGVHVPRHEAGTLVLDEHTKEPTPVKRDTLIVRTRMIGVDYKFKVTGYLNEVRNDILADINNALLTVSGSMLELSELKYNVANSLSDVAVRFSLESNGSLPAALSVEISVLVDKVTYEDATVRGSIELLIKQAVASTISAPAFSVNKMSDAIEKAVGNAVTSFKISSINGNTNLSNWTVRDPDSMVGVKSRLAISNATNELEIQDGIHIGFGIA